jgi:hypothetical protein
VHIDTQILARSRATDRFKDDLRRFVERHEDVPGIVLVHRAPRVKVLRLVHHLLHAHPEFAIERVHIDGRSGCSDFAGTIVVEGAGEARSYEFLWDCRWRAEQEGWIDCFGFPDQMRAAEEFGWRCFARWEPAGAPASAPSVQ